MAAVNDGVEQRGVEPGLITICWDPSLIWAPVVVVIRMLLETINLSTFTCAQTCTYVRM